MKQNILVTGAHRSGTTWLGEVIRKSKGYIYFYEPLNSRGKNIRNPMEFQYESITPDSASERKKEYLAYLNRYQIFSFKNIVDYLFHSKSVFASIKGLAKEPLKLIYQKNILKDPLALLAAEWMYEKLNLKVVVIIRHPCAVVESHKSRGWRFNFSHLTKQPELVLELSPYMELMENISNTEADCVERAAIWWTILNNRVLYYLDKYKDNKDWSFITHEFLLQNPVKNYSLLFDRIGIPFTKRIKNYIEDSTRIQNGKNKHLKRDNTALINKWQNKLTTEEINTVMDICRDTYQKIISNEKVLA